MGEIYADKSASEGTKRRGEAGEDSLNSVVSSSSAASGSANEQGVVGLMNRVSAPLILFILTQIDRVTHYFSRIQI